MRDTSAKLYFNFFMISLPKHVRILKYFVHDKEQRDIKEIFFIELSKVKLFVHF